MLEMTEGGNPNEIARRHGIPAQTIFYWKKAQDEGVLGKAAPKSIEASIPASEYRRIMEENKNLRKSLANMTMDRDILKEAHDIAVKKKWILPVK